LYQSASPHLQQLYTGFLMLHRAGVIRLSQTRRREEIRYLDPAPHLKDASHAHLDALLDGATRVHFDTHDAMELAEGELDTCDFYFKRSYLPSLVGALPERWKHKVLPLGLNYRVLPSTVDLLAARRALALGPGPRSARGVGIRHALDVRNLRDYQPRVEAMSAPPDLAAEPRVLFLVAAYDPHDDPTRSADKIEDRFSLNETRARCVRLLREALGSRFTGGFAASAFTSKHYADLIAPSNLTAQGNYIATLRSHSICVATTGLHGSTGWKLAEYVAFSKAILTEPLVYSVPGDFAPGRNYVEFTTPDECVEAAVRLVEDRELRERLMLANAAYYLSDLRPDALVRNALAKALDRTLKA
jgi:glycosyltransferase involved in cell wall biosynthesis